MKTLIATAMLLGLTAAAHAQTYYSAPINPSHPNLGYTTNGPGGTWYTTPVNPSHPNLGWTTNGPGTVYGPANGGITNPFGFGQPLR